MIRVGKLSLILFAGGAIAGTAVADDIACNSICANERKGLSTPDFVVTYNWNDRVPVCSGLSCESATCSELERKLPNFQTDEAVCLQHQNGLQEAGCECSGGLSSFGGSSWWVATTTVAAAGFIMLL